MNETHSAVSKTALHQNHIDAGAKMVPFAGFDMPVSYAGLIQEHNAVRESCGMFDVSHMGEFRIKGPEALELIQWITTNDASKLEAGKVQYSCMPNGRGGIVDDLLVYCLNKNEFILVVNASNRAKDWEWIASNNHWNAEVTDESDEWSLIAVQGPNAAEYLQPLVNEAGIGDMAYYTFQTATVGGKTVLLSATGYTGAGGFEIYLPNAQAQAVWNALLDAGVEPCGLGARDTLSAWKRVFASTGMTSATRPTSPIAAGLGWITKFSKEFCRCRAASHWRERSGFGKELLRGLSVTARTGNPTARAMGSKLLPERVIGRIVTSGTTIAHTGPWNRAGVRRQIVMRGHWMRLVYIRIRKKRHSSAQVMRPGFLPKG